MTKTSPCIGDVNLPPQQVIPDTRARSKEWGVAEAKRKAEKAKIKIMTKVQEYLGEQEVTDRTRQAARYRGLMEPDIQHNEYRERACYGKYKNRHQHSRGGTFKGD